jgi:beta-glucoside operon transcriptional antiterminator
MKIIKAFNSNVVLVEDNQLRQYILLGKGIGYGKREGHIVNETIVDKIFMPVANIKSKEIIELLDKISIEFVEITQQIVEKAEKELNTKLNSNIYFTLLDHLSFAMERQKKGITITNRVFREIKNYYPEEFKIGLYGLELIYKVFNILLPEEEAANIAFHIFNAKSEETQSRDGMRYAKMVGNIIDLTYQTLNVKLDTNSIHYQRFVTHVKFFVERFFQNKLLSNDTMLYYQLVDSNPKCIESANKVKAYIEKTYKTEISKEEISYLAVHMQRLIIVD